MALTTFHQRISQTQAFLEFVKGKLHNVSLCLGSRSTGLHFFMYMRQPAGLPATRLIWHIIIGKLQADLLMVVTGCSGSAAEFFKGNAVWKAAYFVVKNRETKLRNIWRPVAEVSVLGIILVRIHLCNKKQKLYSLFTLCFFDRKQAPINCLFIKAVRYFVVSLVSHYHKFTEELLEAVFDEFIIVRDTVYDSSQTTDTALNNL